MPILQIRDKYGKFIPINAIKGNDGKSAYEQAKEGGYTGTEEEFISLLNGVTNGGGHYTDFNNPHKITKKQIELGNVPNVATNDQTPTYEEATVLETLTSGEKLSVAFGKIKKATTDLIAHLSDKTKHITSTTLGGGAIGSGAITDSGGAIGSGASASLGGGAVGSGAYSGAGFSGGLEALVHIDNGCAIDAIQLGTGININPKTLQVYDFQLMNEKGKVVSERLPIETLTYVGTGGAGENKKNSLTFSFVPKIVFIVPRSNDWTMYSGFIVDGNGITIRMATQNSDSTHSAYTLNSNLTNEKINWYVGADTLTYSAKMQFNASGVTYTAVAIGQEG